MTPKTKKTMKGTVVPTMIPSLTIIVGVSRKSKKDKKKKT